MLLLNIAVHIHAPKLASYHSRPHPLEIGVAQEPFRKVHLAVIDAVVQLDSQLPGQIIVSID